MMDREHEILLITQEECAEVIQAISKCFRFGSNNYKPGKPHTNKEHLEEELGDLVAMITLLEMHGIISQSKIEVAKLAKMQKLRQWSNIFENTQNA
jgi:NTP pyrophosphatase (non-canonical NTP hydrolase)